MRNWQWRWLWVAMACCAGLGAARAQISRLVATPHLQQEGFGPHGEFLPNDGREYCVPTAFTMAVYWLRANGWPRIAPPLGARNALDTDLAIAGFYGTTPDAGTNGSVNTGAEPKFLVYLGLRGLPGMELAKHTKPDLATISKAVAGFNMGVINIGWYGAKTLERTGGHDVTVVAVNQNQQGQPAPGVIAINNPMAPATQFIPTETLHDMKKPFLNGCLAFTGGILSKPGVIPVIEGVSIIHPGPASQPRAPFAPVRSVDFRATGGSFDVLVPITGKRGIQKRGESSVVLRAQIESAYRGKTRLINGRLVSRLGRGRVFGRGAIEIEGGEVLLAPRGGGNAARLRIGEARRTLALAGGVLTLRRGSNRTLDVEIRADLRRRRGGSLLIHASRGLQELGVSESLRLAGSAPSDLLDAHGIVSPVILGENSDAQRSGDFLRTDAGRGFVRASVRALGANALAQASPDDVAASGVDQVLSPNQIATLHALRLDGASVIGGAGTELRLGDPGQGGVAGLILNGGAIATARLRLDAAETVVYASRAGGRIDAWIAGASSLVAAGPGRLALRAASTFSNGTFVNGATLSVENPEGSATGGGGVLVRADGTLTGNGRIAGDASVAGTLAPGLGVGTLTIEGRADFADLAAYEWELGAETDEASRAGVDWDVLDVHGDLTFDASGRDFQTLEIRFPGGNGPNLQDAFWAAPHRWIIARARGTLDAAGLGVASPRFDAGQFTITATAHTIILVYSPVPAKGS